MSIRTISRVTQPALYYRAQNFQRQMNNTRSTSKTFRLWTQHYSVDMYRNKRHIYCAFTVTYTGGLE